jgi:negative regulator of flagellin synthesis FlgM
MKIGQPTELPTSVTSTASGVAQKAAHNSHLTASAATNAAPSPRTAGVAVTVSKAARALEKPERNEADVDNAKVQSVRAAIQDGSYTVNAEAIADKLLANAQEMIDRTSR